MARGPAQITPRSFGIEEEYQLLDSITGAPIDAAAKLIRALPGLRQVAEREYFSSLLETATPICRSAYEAERSLAEFRQTVSEVAATHRIVLAGTGLPPVGGDSADTVTPKPRYQQIAVEMRNAARHQYATGTHVHVEVPTPDAGIDVIARIARRIPTLLGLSVNSPLWCGKPTGFSSWRHLMALNWPASAFPTGFDSASEYDQAVSNLISTGIVPDTGMLSWVIRLSARYPTVELRIADAQLRESDAVAFAVIVRALVDHALSEAAAGVARPRYTAGIINGSNWMAARNGLGSNLIDPLAAESLPAFELIDQMISTVEVELEQFGDRERIDAYVSRLRLEGDSASRQLTVFEHSGIQGLLELYRGDSQENRAIQTAADAEYPTLDCDSSRDQSVRDQPASDQ